MILKNCQILCNEDLVKKDIRIKGGRIVEIRDEIISENEEVIDIENHVVSPGFIDLHTHLREPGYEYKETIKTATQAAAAGGYTLICAMPNTKPIMDTKEKVMQFNEIVKRDAIVNVMTFSAITEGFSETLVDIKNIHSSVCGFSNDGVGVQSAQVMYDAMKEVSLYKSLISAHCEEESLLFDGYIHEGEKSKMEGWKGILSLTESLQVGRDLLMSDATQCRYHVCHISTKESVELIRNAKRKSNKISCEVTPHHLLLTDMDVKDSQYKMNPPLRSQSDQNELIQGLMDGTIDVIATDHAPHSSEEKNLSIEKAPFGIVGLETAFPLIYTKFVKSSKVSLKQCIEWFSLHPARILNLDSGHIEEGRVADLVVIDIKNKQKIDVNKFYSKGKNSPFHGVECYGFPIMTMVKGEIVFNKKEKTIKGEK